MGAPNTSGRDRLPARSVARDKPGLSDVELSQLYDGHHEYIARRNIDSFEAQQILLECSEFKAPNLLSVVPSGFEISSVIEIGCATGDLLASFPGREANARSVSRTGFDISPLNISVARERYGHIVFSAESFENAPIADAVVLSDVLEHVPDDRDFLRRASLVGRLVLINLPLEDNWLNRNRAYGEDDPSGHLRSYTYRDGMLLVEDAGLTVVCARRVWSHESAYDVRRRALRARLLGSEFSGPLATRVAKSVTHELARLVRPLGRRLYPSNLFISARRTDEVPVK